VYLSVPGERCFIGSPKTILNHETRGRDWRLEKEGLKGLFFVLAQPKKTFEFQSYIVELREAVTLADFSNGIFRGFSL
jgi:hypothetical protein